MTTQLRLPVLPAPAAPGRRAPAAARDAVAARATAPRRGGTGAASAPRRRTQRMAIAPAAVAAAGRSTPETWWLDEQTREIGRRGVEEARAALAAAVARSEARRAAAA